MISGSSGADSILSLLSERPGLSDSLILPGRALALNIFDSDQADIATEATLEQCWGGMEREICPVGAGRCLRGMIACWHNMTFGPALEAVIGRSWFTWQHIRTNS